MNRLLTWFFPLALVSVFAPLAVHADWQGRIEVQGDGSKGKEGVAKDTGGKIFAQGGKVRFEISAQGHEIIVITDIKGQSGAMLMPAQKVVMELPASMADKKMVTCSTFDIEGCLKTKGFKKTGAETVDGHPCDIYEADGTHPDGIKTHQKLWRPTDMKEVFMVKTTSTSDKGKALTMMIRDIKLSKLDSSLFTIPSDYKKMQVPNIGAMHQ